MTVEDAMDKIKAAREYSKFLYELAYEEHDEHTKDCLGEASDLFNEYIDMLKKMKVQEP